jgi:hypothetical protein
MLRIGYTAIVLAACAPLSASACAMATMGKWSAAIEADAVVIGTVVSYERAHTFSAYIGLEVATVLSGDIPNADPLVFVWTNSTFSVPDTYDTGQVMVVALARRDSVEGRADLPTDLFVAGESCARKLFFRVDSKRGEALIDMFTSWWPKTLTARSLDRNLSLYILAPD